VLPSTNLSSFCFSLSISSRSWIDVGKHHCDISVTIKVKKDLFVLEIRKQIQNYKCQFNNLYKENISENTKFWQCQWLLFATTNKRCTAFFSDFLQLPINCKSCSSYLHSTCTLFQVKGILLNVKFWTLEHFSNDFPTNLNTQIPDMSGKFQIYGNPNWYLCYNVCRQLVQSKLRYWTDETS